MSHRATLYVKELRVCPNGDPISKMEKLVLYALADYHQDKVGANTYPSVESLAEESMMDSRSCRRILASAERKGVIERQRPARQGSGHVTFYRFCELDRTAAQQLGNARANAGEKGGHSVPLSETPGDVCASSKRGTKGGQKEDRTRTPSKEERKREQKQIQTPPNPLAREGGCGIEENDDAGTTKSGAESLAGKCVPIRKATAGEGRNETGRARGDTGEDWGYGGDDARDHSPGRVADGDGAAAMLVEAAELVMSKLGVTKRRWRPRIQAVIELRVAATGDAPDVIAVQIIEAVQNQDARFTEGSLSRKFGLMNFLEQGICWDAKRWLWDLEAIRRRSQASVGSYR